MKKRLSQPFFARSFIFISIVVLMGLQEGLVSFAATSSLRLDKVEIAKLNEALSKIEENSLFSYSLSGSAFKGLLTAYVSSIDPYGDYLSAKEVKAFLMAADADYCGVEMDIEKIKGHIFVYPFPGGVAERAGIKPGDELMAVNGSPVYGKSLFVVGASIRGHKQDFVTLTIKVKSGIPKLFSLRRKRTHYAAVSYKNFQNAHYLRIKRFVKGTAKDIEKILADFSKDELPLIVDLRKNRGGYLQEALKCIELFLDKDLVMLFKKSRQGIKRICSAKNPCFKGDVIILQDRFTASAAEVFTAALVDNKRAISLGEKSFGKGLAQRFFFLSDGSALRLTFCELLTPKHKAFNGKGLLPVISLKKESLKDKEIDDNFVNNILFQLVKRHIKRRQDDVK